MSQNSISILGCGYLGLPAAKRFLQQGFAVKGSSTSPETLEQLSSLNITPFLIKTPDLNPTIKDFFDSDVLFLNIPFRRGFKDPWEYKKQCDALVPFIESSRIQRVIFASSTSIYPETVCDAYEDLDFVPDNERSKVLKTVEEMFLNSSLFQTTVLRLAGLFGGERMIGKFLSGKKSIKSAQGYVNLVHFEDVVSILLKIVENNVSPGVINVCCDEHPLRKELYERAAKHLKVPLPTFDTSAEVKGKKVSNKKLKSLLSYEFQYSNLFDFSNH